MAATHVKAVLAKARKAFGNNISLTRCGEQYTTVVDGRPYIWNEELQCFQFLLQLPMPDGTVDMIVMPHQISRPDDIPETIAISDQLFRNWARWPSTNVGAGLLAEDLFLKIGHRLGFQNANEAGTEATHTLRRGTPHEDIYDKADFIFTFPHPDDNQQRSVVPLQLTLNHEGGSKSKSGYVLSNQVAFLPLDIYAGDLKTCMEMLRHASKDSSLDLWRVGEMVRIAVQRYLGHAVSLPNERWFPEEFFDDTTVAMLLPRFKSPLRKDIERRLQEPGQKPGAYLKNAHSCLMAYVSDSGNPYELDFDLVTLTGW